MTAAARKAAPRKSAPRKAAAPTLAAVANDDYRIDAIPEHLRFTTTEKDAIVYQEIEFSLDGRILTAVEPDAGLLTIMVGALAQSATQYDQINAILQLVFGMLDDSSQMWVNRRFRDRHDPFGLPELVQLSEALMELFMGDNEITKRAKNKARAATAR